MASTTTATIELQTLPFQQQKGVKALTARNASTTSINRRLGEVDESTPPAEDTIEQLQQWNRPRINLARLGSACWGFIVMGANDAAVGALIPYLEKHYDLNHTIVSLVFLSPFFGYIASALLNDRVHYAFGQRGIAIMSGTCHLIAYTVAAVHPPFPVLVVIYILAGFGNGLEDAAWNAWVGNMAHHNEALGILHACYGLGATLSPLIATSMITRANLPWWAFYYVMIGFAILELGTSTASFWKVNGLEFRRIHKRGDDRKGAPIKEAMFTLPAARTTWIGTAFLFLYVGVEVALGGWIVTFMMDVRHGSAFASGMSATGFWLGMTVGRVVLGFVTPRLGENLSVLIYIPITIALELLFWLVPQFYVSAVAVALQGFFLGPLFPAVVVACTRILPKHLHVFAIGFAAAAGGTGAAVFPFAVGAIAQSTSQGVRVLQPIILALLACLFLLWISLPKITKKND